MPHNAYHVLVREWNPETWEFSPMYEVKVDKNILASKFSIFLSEKVFPHIPADNLFSCKVSKDSMKNFKRGDLVLRKWSRLKNQSTWLGQSTIEINKDSVYVIVKDSTKVLREALTDVEITKYASKEFINHMLKRGSKEGNVVSF